MLVIWCVCYECGGGVSRIVVIWPYEIVSPPDGGILVGLCSCSGWRHSRSRGAAKLWCCFHDLVWTSLLSIEIMFLSSVSRKEHLTSEATYRRISRYPEQRKRLGQEDPSDNYRVDKQARCRRSVRSKFLFLFFSRGKEFCVVHRVWCRGGMASLNTSATSNEVDRAVDFWVILAIHRRERKMAVFSQVIEWNDILIQHELSHKSLFSGVAEVLSLRNVSYVWGVMFVCHAIAAIFQGPAAAFQMMTQGASGPNNKGAQPMVADSGAWAYYAFFLA